MAVVSRAIPTLLRGVSQAADSTKQADHADIQDNANIYGTSWVGRPFLTGFSHQTI